MAEADKGDNKREASVVQIIIRSIEKKNEKSNKQEVDKGEKEKKLEKHGLGRNFQIFFNLVIFQGCCWVTGVHLGCRSAFRIQRCLFHMT